MKRIAVIIATSLAGLSLVACGNNDKQAKENSSLKAQNSSLKAKQQSKENSSLKAENNSLKNDKGNQLTNGSNNNQEDPSNLSNEEIATRFKSLKGTTSSDYHASVTNNGNGTYTVDLGKDTPDGQRVEHIGKYLYNAKINSITTIFESGLN